MVRNDSFQQTGRDMLLVDVLCPRLRGSGSCLRYVRVGGSGKAAVTANTDL